MRVRKHKKDRVLQKLPQLIFQRKRERGREDIYLCFVLTLKLQLKKKKDM